MPVYDRRYRGYTGERLPARGLFWTLARYGFGEVFSKRLLLVLYVFACLPVLVFATLIYVANNLEVLKTIGISDVSRISQSLSGSFFFWFMAIWIFITIFGDIFRRNDLSGGMKAVWIIVLVLLPFLGAIIYMVARDQFSGINPQYWYFWIGTMLIAVVIFLPNGVLGGLARFWSSTWSRA